MSVTMEVVLFDARAYRESILPAWRAAVENGEVGPLRGLLQSAEGHAPEESLWHIGEEVERLVREAKAARARGDLARAEEADWRLYEVVKEGRLTITRGEIRTALVELERASVDRRMLWRATRIDQLIQLWCIPRDQKIKARLNLSALGLEHYLRTRSKVIDEAFAGELPHTDLEPSAWEWSFWLEHDVVRALKVELDRLPPPPGFMERRVFEQFQALILAVLANKSLVLVIAQ